MSDARAIMSQGGIRYSQVWEDHALLEQGLQIGPDDDVLSITSAGDNVLALLLLGPRSVTAIDLNPAQQALLELKLAAIAKLSHDEFVCLCGARDGHDRLALYQRVREGLSDDARAYWDANSAAITAGLLECGRLERYIAKFHQDYVAKLLPPDAIPRMQAAPDRAAQIAIFEQAFATPHFQKAFRGFFGREELAREGRSPEQFQYVAGIDVGEKLWQRFRYACTELPVRGNFYLEYIMTRRYGDLEQGPPYLRPSNFDRLQKLAPCVRLVTARLDELLASEPAGAFSKANLSDVFEYLSEEVSDALMGQLATALRPRGRFAYWNLLVPRKSRHPKLRTLDELGDSLWRRDRSWFYSAFRVEEVVG